MVKLIGSAGSLEHLLKLVQGYFYNPLIRFEPKGQGWAVVNSKGQIDGFRVVSKGKRYRFEMEVSQ